MKNLKHDFLSNEDDANLRLREDAQETIFYAIQRSREGEGILTLNDLSMVITKALGNDDAAVLSELMRIRTAPVKAKFIKGVGIRL